MVRVCKADSLMKGAAGVARIGELGQAKVENFGGTTIDEENVCRLDIAMDNAFGVGRFEAVGDLDAEVEKFGDGDGLAGDAALERLTFEELDGDERAAFEFADIVNGADVRMIERRGGAGFAAEPFDGLGILRDVVGEEFQGDVATEAGVFGFVDDTHSTATEFFQYAVVRDAATKNRGGVCHREWSLTQGLGCRQIGGSIGTGNGEEV